METGDRIVVAMSGGVDSSVAAALLKHQGYQVIGMMMRLWSEPGRAAENRCCTPDSMALARRVADRLGIPFYTVDAKNEFRDTVVDYFIEGYARGFTPNPCLVCNKQIRWTFLLDHAKAAGADYMATGHYARLDHEKDRPIKLLKGLDSQKDQSYVLHVLNQKQLERAVFPLGGFSKKEVRQLARDYDLPAASVSESQDLCFLGSEDYRQFLSRNRPALMNPGQIKHIDGATLGEHKGLAFYTIGQRKGLGIAANTPLYVLSKDTKNNVLIVGESVDLGKKELRVKQVNWISGEPNRENRRLSIKIRYQQKETMGIVQPIGNSGAVVKFEANVLGITPGQAAVFYDDQECIGGGIIQ
jgi:tRNA-specific 2-thiouridylase